jgi:hypothetical protein
MIAWPVGAPVQCRMYGYEQGSTALPTFVGGGWVRSLLLRRTFVVEAPSAIRRLILRADYEDGLIVWLNGEEVVRRFGWRRTRRGSAFTRLARPSLISARGRFPGTTRRFAGAEAGPGCDSVSVAGVARRFQCGPIVRMSWGRQR